MKKIIENIMETVIPGVAAVCLTGSLFGLAYLASPKVEVEPEKQVAQYVPKTRAEKLNSTCWYLYEKDEKGNPDVIVTPHRNNYYGTKGPIYVSGQGDLEGKKIFDLAKDLIDYKNDLSKVAGSEQKFPWLCRVDDFDGDSIADKISWPRMGENMPVYEKPFSSEIQKKANKVVLLENQVLAYVINKK
ncbi:MAG: hypothetical protein PF542_01325 [Nanoarchaeota archaeon]|nr:hypothetical protein [Nanoarchaeota archaeon]